MARSVRNRGEPGYPVPGFIGGCEREISDHITETKADRITIVVGTFQPFNKGHGKLIRKLGKGNARVIVLIEPGDGLPPDDVRRVVALSLVDLGKRLEIYEMRTGEPLHSALSRISVGEASAFDMESGAEVYVPAASIRQYSQDLKQPEEDEFYDPQTIALLGDPTYASFDVANGVDSSRIRAALSAGQWGAAKRLLDQLVCSDGPREEGVKEILMGAFSKNESLHEDMSDVAGEAGIQKILNVNARRLRASKGIDVARLKKLGSGDMGVAYEIDGSRVLKVTTDEGEARAAQRIKGKTDFRHVVRIYDVFQLRSVTNYAVFGIIEEKLQKISPEEEKQIWRIKNFLRDPELIKSAATLTWPAFASRLKEKLRRQVAADMEGSNPAFISKRVDKIYSEIEAQLRKFNVDRMIDELRSMGVQFADYHEGNIMKRGGHFVITDLGKAVAFGGNPPVLERSARPAFNEASTGFSPTDLGGQHVGAKAGSSAWSGRRTSGTGSMMNWQDFLPLPKMK